MWVSESELEGSLAVSSPTGNDLPRPRDGFLPSRLWRTCCAAALAVGRHVLDFFYPPHCAGCSIRLGTARALCGGCWSSVQFIEHPYCAVLGIPFAHNQGEGAISTRAMAEPPDFDRLRAVASYDGVVRSIVHGLKYRDRTDLSLMMAAWMVRAGREALQDADVIIPVPLHRNRLFLRRFNQSAELARAIARQSGIAYHPRALLRRKATARQVGLGRKARLDNVRGAFAVTTEGREALFGKRVILVDDVFTTGATVSAAARALKRVGVTDVTVLTFAMAQAEPI